MKTILLLLCYIINSCSFVPSTRIIKNTKKFEDSWEVFDSEGVISLQQYEEEHANNNSDICILTPDKYDEGVFDSESSIDWR